jgi:signal transduction histidine kinase
MKAQAQAQAQAQARLRWWQYLGPWPYRPWVSIISVGLLSTPLVLDASESILADPISVVSIALVPSAVGALTIFVALSLANRYLRYQAPRRLITYLLYVLGSLTLGMLVASVARLLLGNSFDLVAVALISGTARLALWTFLVLALVGLANRRLHWQVQMTQQALDLSLHRQLLLVISEERSRRQIARLLHDRVQSVLMTSCLELRAATAPGISVDHEKIDRIIAKLEGVRGIDVRQAARALSPELGNVDLHTALKELAALYEPGMKTEIRIDPWIGDPAAQVPEDMLLACYRIAEQGLLNAVVHGNSTKAILEIAPVDTGQLQILLTDNGKSGADTEITPGLGSAVLDSWCRMFAGEWKLDILPAGGARLTARIEFALPAIAGLTP